MLQETHTVFIFFLEHHAISLETSDELSVPEMLSNKKKSHFQRCNAESNVQQIIRHSTVENLKGTSKCLNTWEPKREVVGWKKVA